MAGCGQIEKMKIQYEAAGAEESSSGEDHMGLIGLKLLPAQRFQNGMTGCLLSGMRDFTVIMGSSGAGKSTLLYALSGMDKIPDG